jgi:fucose 4-O-acetylase-like acetyltransferase
MAQRTDWVDYGKGIGIILVVYAHLLSSGYHAGLHIQEHFFLLSDSIVYSFHMPFFFFLAGLLVGKSYNKRGTREFIGSKVKFLVYPYLLWSFVQAGSELLFSEHSLRGVTVSDIWAIPYLPLAQFWYLYALLWMYVAYALLHKLGEFALAAMIVSACLFFYFPINTEILALHGFSTGFIFFVSAVLMKKYLGDLEKYTMPPWATVVFFSVLLGAGYYIFENRIEPTRLTNGLHPFYFLFLAVLGITFCVGLAQYLARKKYCQIVQSLGIYSLQIYLVHMLAGVGARIVLWNYFHIQNPLVHMIIGMGAGLSAPIILYKIALKMDFPYFFEPGRNKLRGLR